MEVLRGWLIRRSELWGSRLMDLWSRSGFAGQARAAATSAYGRSLHWAASRGLIWKGWPNLTGRATAHDSRTTHPAPETRFLDQTATCDRRAAPSLLRLRGFTATFRFGRPTRRSSTSFKVGCPTNWTSGAFVRLVEFPNGSRRTMGK